MLSVRLHKIHVGKYANITEYVLQLCPNGRMAMSGTATGEGNHHHRLDLQQVTLC
jgi:hypothetical protein